MKKEETVRGCGINEKQMQQRRRWEINNPEICRKGGRYYEKHLKDNRTGLQGERNVIRHNHGYIYRPFKQIIAPASQIHHEWIPETPDYRGVALVETDQHQYGFVDVIQILEGEITLLTEAEIRGAIERNG